MASMAYTDLNKLVNAEIDVLNADDTFYTPQKPADTLFHVRNCVQIFFIGIDGRVSTFSEPSDLRVFRLKDNPNDELSTTVFIQCGGWTNPLLSGVSPSLEASNGAFMFPDVYGKAAEAGEKSSSVGIIFSDESGDEIKTEFRRILTEHTVFKSEEVNEEEALKLGAIGRTIYKAGELVNKGLDVSTKKACELIEQYGEAQMAKLEGTAEADPNRKVSRVWRYSAKGAMYATTGTVKVSGFVANRVGKLSKSVASYLATQVVDPNKKGNSGGGGSIKESKSFQSIVDAARGGLLAYGAVHAGLEANAKVLGDVVKDQTVTIVERKYGEHAGETACDAATAAGNAAMTYLNVQSLGVKGLVKKTAKQTGKDLAKNIVTKNT